MNYVKITKNLSNFVVGLFVEENYKLDQNLCRYILLNTNPDHLVDL